MGYEDDEDDLRIPADLRDDLCLSLIDRGKAGVEAREGLDNDCADYADAANGIASPAYQEVWSGSSSVVHPALQIEKTNLDAALIAPLMQQNLLQVGAKKDEEKADAKAIEAFLNDKNEEEDFARAYQDFISNMTRDPAAVMYQGWEDKTKQETNIHYWDGENKPYGADNKPELIPAEMRDPENPNYVEVPVEETVVEKSGACYRPVDLVNFYLIPATARSLETAYGTAERRVLTESELLDGIRSYGYDKEAVMELVSLPGTLGTDSSDYRQQQNSAAGVTDTVSRPAMEKEYECFLYFGNLPYLWEGGGEARLPEQLWHKNVTAMWCPGHNIVFKLAANPFPVKFPYVMQSLVPKANSPYGYGYVQVVLNMQHEATHYLRATSNAIDIEGVPVLKVKSNSYELNKGFEFAPGAQFIEDEENGLQALEIPKSGLLNLELAQYFTSLIKQGGSAEGYGELQTKQRKNGEVANVVNAVDTKYNFLKFNAYTPIPELMRRRTLYEAHFNGGNAQTQVEGKPVDISADVLRKTYRYSVAQTNADSSPDAQQAKSEAIFGLQTRYLQAKQMAAQINPMTGQPGMSPEDLGLIYNLTADTMPIFDVREATRYLGEKPEPAPMAGNPMVAGMAQNPMGAMMTGGQPSPQIAAMGGA